MGAKTAITADQYLATSFPDLDKEYRDGELVERSLPDYLHGKTQLLIADFFAALRKKLSLHGCTETRMKLRNGLYFIPDVAAFHPVQPSKLVPETPPLVAVEILSPDDRMTEVLDKLQDYREWGVAHVWLVNPHSKRLYVFAAGLTPVTSLRIPELGVEMTPGDIFE